MYCLLYFRVSLKICYHQVGQQISFLLATNTKVHYHARKILSLDPTLSHFNPVHPFSSYFSNIHFIAVLSFALSSPMRPLPLRFPNKKSVSSFPHACHAYVSRQFHSSQFNDTNNMKYMATLPLVISEAPSNEETWSTGDIRH